MKNKINAIISFLLIGGICTLNYDVSAQDASASKRMPDLSSWPKASKMAAEEMKKKYGSLMLLMRKSLAGWMQVPGK